MNNSIYKIIKPLLIENSYELINSVKILLFKENQSIFELLDFNDETIYLDPFIFMYVKNREQVLENIIIGYAKNNMEIEITTIPLDVEIHEISKRHIENITKAYNLIKINIPSQFKLIEKYAPKCVIFKVDTNKRNSFATFAANGISFFNAYQSDYDEVFFIDDIAHQTRSCHF